MKNLIIGAVLALTLGACRSVPPPLNAPPYTFDNGAPPK